MFTLVINKNKTYPFQYLLNDLQKVSLDELDTVSLLDRKDTKFVFNQIDLPHILEKLKPFYRILEINNDRVYTYDTTYFDTDDFRFYVQHHNGSRNRFKVRFRKYSSNKKSFFEIKIKNNKDRTIKKRLKIDEIKYKSYLDQYLKSPHSPDIPLWEIFTENIKR